MTHAGFDLTARPSVGARLRARWRARDAGPGDRGSSSVELVLYTPMLMLVTLLAVQFALSWHGNEIAGAVARETARVVRAGGGDAQSLADARARGMAYAEAIGGNALRDVDIEAVVIAEDLEVRVTVTGRSVEIIGGLAPRVSATVQGPVEVFRPDV